MAYQNKKPHNVPAIPQQKENCAISISLTPVNNFDQKADRKSDPAEIKHQRKKIIKIFPTFHILRNEKFYDLKFNHFLSLIF